MEIRLFGGLEALIDSQPLPPLHSRKGRYLLALLALRHDRETERAWLAGVLWPESAESQALFNLRQCLSDLRHALGAEAERVYSPTPRTLRLLAAHLRRNFCPGTPHPPLGGPLWTGYNLRSYIKFFLGNPHE